MDVDVFDLVNANQLVNFLCRSFDLARLCSVVDAVVMVGSVRVFERVGLAVGRE